MLFATKHSSDKEVQPVTQSRHGADITHHSPDPFVFREQKKLQQKNILSVKAQLHLKTTNSEMLLVITITCVFVYDVNISLFILRGRIGFVYRRACWANDDRAWSGFGVDTVIRSVPIRPLLPVGPVFL